MTTPARRERAALCDTFEAVGPDAPTLCSPWRTRDLATHLVIREGRPDAALAMVVPPLAERARRVHDAIAAQSWPELVERVRTGPPAWSPTRLEPVDAVVNLAEMFLHHEDVLRGAPGWEPRLLPDDLEQGLWSVLTRTGRLLFRRSRVGVVLVTPTYGRRLVRTPPSGAGSVVLRGTPGELLLHASGRQRVARVTVEGPADARAAFEGTHLSL
jgi:uncharacterized protein (TIGR03085 family)